LYEAVLQELSLLLVAELVLEVVQTKRKAKMGVD